MVARSGCGQWRPVGAETARLEGHRGQVQSPLRAGGRTGRLGLPGQHDPPMGCGATAPRPPASMGILLRFRPFACCRTGGSPRALRTARSGCGTWRQGSRWRALTGTIGQLGALCFLPDRRLASGEDNTIQLWDVVTGTETARLSRGMTERSTRFACCPTGGSPRAPRGWHDPAVGGRDWGRDFVPSGTQLQGQRPLPARGRAARLLLLGQDDSAVGRCGRRRSSALRGTFQRNQRPLFAQGWPARLRFGRQHDQAVGCRGRLRNRPPRKSTLQSQRIVSPGVV